MPARHSTRPRCSQCDIETIFLLIHIIIVIVMIVFIFRNGRRSSSRRRIVSRLNPFHFVVVAQVAIGAGVRGLTGRQERHVKILFGRHVVSLCWMACHTIPT